MDAIVQLVEENQKKHEDGEDDVRKVRNWISIEHSGLNFRGRFVPDTEFDPESFTSKLSPLAKENFEAWLRETTTLAVKTEINVQLGEFTIKKNVTRPLEPEMQDSPDFSLVFDDITHDDILQCAEVKNTTNRKWYRLVGLGYDLQLWVPDLRQVTHGYKRLYEGCRIRWLEDIIEPWRNLVLPNIELFIGSDNPEIAETVILYGLVKPSLNPNPKSEKAEKADEPPPIYTLREIIVYRYPRVFHIFNVVEHGRRWYRSIIFSSDPLFTLHDLKMESFHIDKKLLQCSGDPSKKYEPAKSLIINRYLNDDVAAAQTFVPLRFLYGLAPTALLQNYDFWQNNDDSLTGYMPLKRNLNSARSIIKITLLKTGHSDNSGFGLSNANAVISRVFTLEDPSIKDLNFYTVPDPEKPIMYVVSLLSLMNRYCPQFNSDRHSVGRRTKLTEFADFPDESKTLHSLIRILLRVESFAHIIAWTKEKVTPDADISVDLIELPRLRLSFEKKILSDGTVRYICLEQNGQYIAAYSDELKFYNVLDGLSHTILLTNEDNEYSVVIPATIKPVLIKSKVAKYSYKMIAVMTDKDWLANTGESGYFTYPIHSSGCFISSRSIASTLYLLLLRLMSHNYVEAFKLIESCVCDKQLTPQEQQIYNIIADIKDDLEADCFACRLKLYFVTFGCSNIMPYPFNVEEDLFQYIKYYRLVSSACRLTPDEEAFIMSNVPENSKFRTHIFLNRERILKASFDLTFDKFTPRSKVKTFTPFYPDPVPVAPYNPEPFDLELLDCDKPNFKNLIQKLAYVKYHKPEATTGPEAIKFLLKVFDFQKNLGFFVIYNLMTKNLPICIIPDLESPHSVGTVMLRVLPDNFITGLQRVILRILEENPTPAEKMPGFEDTRKYKLPTLAGLDIFQSHIKHVCQYIKANRTEIEMTNYLFAPLIPAPFKPINSVNISLTAEDTEDFSINRSWLNPKVRDFTCDQRIVASAIIPKNITSFVQRFTDTEISHLAGTPLDAINLSSFIEFKSLKSRGENPVSSNSPLKVMSHPSSRSHIARTSVARLEVDIVDFATDENSSQIPMLKVLNNLSHLESNNLSNVVAEVTKMISLLEKVRESDIKFVKQGVDDIVDYCNGDHACHYGDIGALTHRLKQNGHSETYLDFEFLATSTASADAAGDLKKWNPFLSRGDVDGLICCIMLLMMTANRINHCILALQQSRSLLKLLKALQNPNLDNVASDRLKKELLSLSENLSATLANKRNYSKEVSKGVYSLDPRFLLFEFCHGLILRLSQVQLVTRLLQDMVNGRSVCHQMIMGAGKTTVVGPLLAMLLANSTTMMIEVVPPALLDFSAGILRERFSAGIRKPIFTFTFDRYDTISSTLLCKLLTARNLRAVIVSTPSFVKSFMLKFLEICHNLSRQRNITLEKSEKNAIRTVFSLSQIRNLLGLGYRKTMSSGELSKEEIVSLRKQASLADRIFHIMRDSIEIMDEVDIILHPLKSELNWPLGAKGSIIKILI